MTPKIFHFFLVFLGAGFAVALTALCVPPLVQNPDLLGAIASGFVNPYASGYALDAICCWLVLAVWVVYEAKTRRIRYGWVALLLGVMPGVTTGFAVYLLLRFKQEQPPENKNG